MIAAIAAALRPAIVPALRPAIVPALALALLGAGCSGYLPAPFAMEPSGASTPATRPDFLPITRLRWIRNGETAMLLKENGVLYMGERPLGVLRPDGSFILPDNRRTLVMSPDGAAHVRAGFDVQVSEDGTATTRVHGQTEETITLDDVGKTRAGRAGLQLEGLTLKYRRTAMWILMIPDLLRVQAESE